MLPVKKYHYSLNTCGKVVTGIWNVLFLLFDWPEPDTKNDDWMLFAVLIIK